MKYGRVEKRREEKSFVGDCAESWRWRGHGRGSLFQQFHSNNSQVTNNFNNQLGTPANDSPFRYRFNSRSSMEKTLFNSTRKASFFFVFWARCSLGCRPGLKQLKTVFFFPRLTAPQVHDRWPRADCCTWRAARTASSGRFRNYLVRSDI